MKQKILQKTSSIILVIVFLNIFAFSVKYVTNGGKKLGIFTEPFKSFISYPSTVLAAINQFRSLPHFYIKVDPSMQKVNNLDYDVYALNDHFDNNYVYRLFNLRTDSVLHKWIFKEENFNGTAEHFRRAHSQNPILLENRSLIGMLSGTRNLFRMDSESNMVWHNTEKEVHHSLNLADDGNIWACTRDYAFSKNEHENITVKFMDDFITKVDVNTGDILFDKSISELLIENGHSYLVHGFGNEEKSQGEDLFHMNDIEPIMEDGEFWQKGDVLISLRHRSMIILYRPATNEILRLISGPFFSQHDVDVYSGNQISIFNNNRTHTYKKADKEDDVTESSIRMNFKSSNVVIYNFADSTFEKPSLELFEKEKIYTKRQGLHTFLSNGDLFVESTEKGLVYILRDDELILKDYINSPKNGTVEYPHWARLYENIDF